MLLSSFPFLSTAPRSSEARRMICATALLHPLELQFPCWSEKTEGVAEETLLLLKPDRNEFYWFQIELVTVFVGLSL